MAVEISEAECLREWSYLRRSGHFVEGGAWAETDWVVLLHQAVSTLSSTLGNSTSVH